MSLLRDRSSEVAAAAVDLVAELLTEVLGMPLLLLCMILTVGSVQSQGSPQDAFIIQYLERRLAQMEVNDCCSSYDVICIHQADSTIECNFKNIFCFLVLLCVRFCLLTSYVAQ